MKPWIKVSTLLLDDPEMEYLQQCESACLLVWVWCLTECCKKQDPTIPLITEATEPIIARRLGIRANRFSKALAILGQIGWIKEGKIRNWQKWNSDPELETIRKREAYWRKKAASQPVEAQGNHSESPAFSENLRDSPESPKTSPKRRGEEIRGEDIRTKRTSVWELSKIIEAKEKQSKAIFNRYASDTASGVVWGSPDKANEYKRLRSEIKRLNGEIAKRA